MHARATHQIRTAAGALAGAVLITVALGGTASAGPPLPSQVARECWTDRPVRVSIGGAMAPLVVVCSDQLGLSFRVRNRTTGLVLITPELPRLARWSASAPAVGSAAWLASQMVWSGPTRGNWYRLLPQHTVDVTMFGRSIWLKLLPTESARTSAVIMLDGWFKSKRLPKALQKVQGYAACAELVGTQFNGAPFTEWSDVLVSVIQFEGACGGVRREVIGWADEFLRPAPVADDLTRIADDMVLQGQRRLGWLDDLLKVLGKVSKVLPRG